MVQDQENRKRQKEEEKMNKRLERERIGTGRKRGGGRKSMEVDMLNVSAGM